jgi:hypothetical protein
MQGCRRDVYPASLAQCRRAARAARGCVHSGPFSPPSCCRCMPSPRPVSRSKDHHRHSSGNDAESHRRSELTLEHRHPPSHRLTNTRRRHEGLLYSPDRRCRRKNCPSRGSSSRACHADSRNCSPRADRMQPHAWHCRGESIEIRPGATISALRDLRSPRFTSTPSWRRDTTTWLHLQLAPFHMASPSTIRPRLHGRRGRGAFRPTHAGPRGTRHRNRDCNPLAHFRPGRHRRPNTGHHPPSLLSHGSHARATVRATRSHVILTAQQQIIPDWFEGRMTT